MDSFNKTNTGGFQIQRPGLNGVLQKGSLSLEAVYKVKLIQYLIKKSMNRKLILIAIVVLLSCGKERELENTFVTKKSEYWQYNDDCAKSRVYFRFNKNGSYDKYLKSYTGFDLFNNDGDLLSGSRTWSLKNDSIFVWDNEEYRIEKYGTQQIRLSYYHYKKKNKKCSITLNKIK